MRQAILTISTFFLMLGIVLTLVALLAIGLRSPSELQIWQLTPDRAVVFGGENAVSAFVRIFRELGIAIVIACAGALGVLSIKRGERTGYFQLSD